MRRASLLWSAIDQVSSSTRFAVGPGARVFALVFALCPGAAYQHTAAAQQVYAGAGVGLLLQETGSRSRLMPGGYVGVHVSRVGLRLQGGEVLGYLHLTANILYSVVANPYMRVSVVGGFGYALAVFDDFEEVRLGLSAQLGPGLLKVGVGLDFYRILASEAEVGRRTFAPFSVFLQIGG